MSVANQNVWIMGCGDIGRRVARLYQNEGTKAIGWVRSEESLQLGLAQGIAMRQGDVDRGSFFPIFALDEALVYWFMPPQPTGETDDRIRRFLKGVDAAPKRVVLISTTGVYGDCDGRWIDETEPLKPVAARAKRRVDAENTVQEWATRFGGESVILRVPGIYAPDRLPLERLKRGEPVLTEAEAPWTNRIHADDLAMVCKRAMEAPPRWRNLQRYRRTPFNHDRLFQSSRGLRGITTPAANQHERSTSRHESRNVVVFARIAADS